jgi:hypothetical protein
VRCKEAARKAAARQAEHHLLTPRTRGTLGHMYVVPRARPAPSFTPLEFGALVEDDAEGAAAARKPAQLQVLISAQDRILGQEDVAHANMRQSGRPPSLQRVRIRWRGASDSDPASAAAYMCAVTAAAKNPATVLVQEFMIDRTECDCPK